MVFAARTVKVDTLEFWMVSRSSTEVNLGSLPNIPFRVPPMKSPPATVLTRSAPATATVAADTPAERERPDNKFAQKIAQVEIKCLREWVAQEEGDTYD
jgi:hypothetical protein